jgi:surface protein
MEKTLKIFTDNYSGYSADITFYPYTGGTIYIGIQDLPYDYNTDYYYGIYEIYILVFNKLCELDYSPPVCDFSGSVISTSFVSTWMTDNFGFTSPDQIGIVLDSSGTFDFVIDWGDGNTNTITTWDQPDLIHTYNTIGTYTITMTGVINGFSMQYYSGDYGKILSIQQWGNVKLIDGGGQFANCINLDLSMVSDVLDTSNLTNIDFMFGECNSLTSVNNIELWDISNLTSLYGLFVDCFLFNQDLNNWVVSGVTNMNAMFYGCPLFDQPLNNWDVSNVTDMGFMFYACSSFNQPLNNWIVSGVTNMEYMFVGTQFDQPLNNWNVSGVTNMSAMFPISPFNQNINNWDVSNVIYMSFMFEDTIFDQPLSGWNVSNVVDMTRMFRNSQFSQDIGNWNISGVTSFADFMDGKTPSSLSTTNLNSIYNGWSTKNPKPNLNITFGSAKYTLAGQPGKDTLTGSTMSGGYGWTITDGGI